MQIKCNFESSFANNYLKGLDLLIRMHHDFCVKEIKYRKKDLAALSVLRHKIRALTV